MSAECPGVLRDDPHTVIRLEYWSAESADFQILDIHVRENCVLQLPPHTVAGALVEVVHLRGDVGVVEGVGVGLLRDGKTSPHEVGPPREVSAVEVVVEVELIADLVVLADLRVLDELDPLPAEPLERAAVDVPGYLEREPSRGAHL